jgi:hypothetical protein
MDKPKKSLRSAHGLDVCDAVIRDPCAHVDTDDHHRPIGFAIVNQKLTLGHPLSKVSTIEYSLQGRSFGISRRSARRPSVATASDKEAAYCKSRCCADASRIEPSGVDCKTIGETGEDTRWKVHIIFRTWIDCRWLPIKQLKSGLRPT